MATYKTPGVYINELNGFPNSVVAVATAVPVFIGYTEKAEQNGKSLVGQPVPVSSLVEYEQWFGTGFQQQFGLQKAKGSQAASGSVVVTRPATLFYLYNCLRLYFANGGNPCYILCTGTYGEGTNKKTTVDAADFNDQLLTALNQCPEITLVLAPDLVNDRNGCYLFYQKMLQYCGQTQSCFAIMDLVPEVAGLEATVQNFRGAIGTAALSYGAAYYPWLHTLVVPAAAIDLSSLNLSPAALKDFLPEPAAVTAIDNWIAAGPAIPAAAALSSLHQSLTTASSTYRQIMADINTILNLLPPSAAIAGIYCNTDNTEGVWKAPANVSLSLVETPAVSINDQQQAPMNVDAVTGKSVNAIRSILGNGTVVWGARTLDGNSNDWRYINVRRTIMMIEQSVKLACQAYVFEPNNANTWATVTSMISNFLTELWKQGALAGSKPEDAFSVRAGLGVTMTADDLLQGILRVTIAVSLLHPSEFIIISFQQQQQTA